MVFHTSGSELGQFIIHRDIITGCMYKKITGSYKHVTSASYSKKRQKCTNKTCTSNRLCFLEQKKQIFVQIFWEHPSRKRVGIHHKIEPQLKLGWRNKNIIDPIKESPVTVSEEKVKSMRIRSCKWIKKRLMKRRAYKSSLMERHTTRVSRSCEGGALQRSLKRKQISKMGQNKENERKIEDTYKIIIRRAKSRASMVKSLNDWSKESTKKMRRHIGKMGRSNDGKRGIELYGIPYKIGSFVEFELGL